MTDKKNNFVKDINVPCKEQIICHGVNVSKCEYYKDGMCYAECDLEGYTDWECHDEDLNNCYFKQLARKTQECEQKDKEINELHLIIDRLLEASGYDKHISSAEDFEDVYKDMDYKLGLIDELKQECDELKERIKCNCFDPKSNNNRCISYNRIAEDYERDLKRLENKIAECEKYEGTFRRIEKLSKINCEEICGKSYEACDDKDCLAIQIRDIINKAKEKE